jgi:cephalosporin hydroxylase
MKEEYRQEYAGLAGDIFFNNEGPMVHKWLHYLPIYDQLFGPFAGKPVRMLEIGVSRGGSLVMWRKFFGDQATIFGVDIDPRCSQYNGQAGQVRIGSQADPAFLRSVVDEMGGVDLILDDGSHISTHQRASYEVLFPLLTEGGLYVIEDMHTAYWPRYEGGLRRRGTAIEFLKAKVDEMHRVYQKKGLNTPEAASEIESIQFFDSIAAVRKRKQAPRYHLQIPRP